MIVGFSDYFCLKEMDEVGGAWKAVEEAIYSQVEGLAVISDLLP